MRVIWQIAFKEGLWEYVFAYTLVDDLLLEKHLHIIFQKQWVRDIPYHYRLAKTTHAQARQVTFLSFETHLGP